jgi:glycerate-2-kinase
MMKFLETHAYKRNTTIIWSGEPEVSIPVSAINAGEGGRISSLLALLSERIDHLNNIIIIGLATDGMDGSSPSSGYFITSETKKHIRPLGGANKIISKGNSGRILTSLNYGIELGYTDINLLDLYLAVLV